MSVPKGLLFFNVENCSPEQRRNFVNFLYSIGVRKQNNSYPFEKLSFFGIRHDGMLYSTNKYYEDRYEESLIIEYPEAFD